MTSKKWNSLPIILRNLKKSRIGFKKKIERILRECNIRPEDTYRRKTKLSLKTTG